MKKKLGVNIVIEREKVGKKEVFIASSPDVNVLVEGHTIDEAKKKFREGLKTHLKIFPQEKFCLVEKNEYELPIVARVFL